MASDPVILDVLASICKDALQMFERVVLAFDDKEYLGGAFKYFLFSSLFGEMIQFD